MWEGVDDDGGEDDDVDVVEVVGGGARRVRNVDVWECVGVGSDVCERR